jgi:hypothetical protein
MFHDGPEKREGLAASLMDFVLVIDSLQESTVDVPCPHLG